MDAAPLGVSPFEHEKMETLIMRHRAARDSVARQTASRFPRRVLLPYLALVHLLLSMAMSAGIRPSAIQAAEGASTSSVSPLTPEQLEFFEKKIRPVLAERCYSCHNSTDKREGGLAVDSRDALLQGGDTGVALVPGKPADSRLLQAMRHEIEGLEMPQDGAKLPEDVLQDFARWIEQSAPDPRDAPPSPAELSAANSWEAIRARRAEWWSFRGVQEPPVPVVANRPDLKHPIDRFILAKLQQEQIEPSHRADRWTLVRRVYLVLTGLPPTPEQATAFAMDERPDAYERLVQKLLDAPEFGEAWARHWMDWMRYSESHGSEGDPAVPFAWQYRDYLIRALNADVPYDQLVREHLAGDLIPPRLDATGTINESKLGVAHFRFVQHGFSPTDPLDELVRFTDNQIDVLSKAFLATTLSCARCHHHKFDPISQRDYYALFGVLASCRPATVDVRVDAQAESLHAKMDVTKRQIRNALAAHWLRQLESFASTLSRPDTGKEKQIQQATAVTDPLSIWRDLRNRDGEAFATIWQQRQQQIRESAIRMSQQETAWNSAGSRQLDPRQTTWFGQPSGIGPSTRRPAGEFPVLASGDRITNQILPAGYYSHLITDKGATIWSSPRFHLDAKKLFVRVSGSGNARARYVVQHYPRGGTVYPITTLNDNVKDNSPKWISWDLEYWRGDQAHLELSTAADQAVEGSFETARSSIGVTDVVLLSDEQVAEGEVPKEEPAEFLSPLFAPMDASAASSVSVPTTPTELAVRYQQTLIRCVTAWRDGSLTDAEARFLHTFVASNWLETRLGELPDITSLVEHYRSLEAELLDPMRAPGLLEADVIDAALFERGDHKRPREAVPRGFLEVIRATGESDASADATTRYPENQSGRLQWAEELLDPANPLTRRVIVNRLWHYVFGRGIVDSPDNFGHLGSEPTHPELLDWLASQFIKDNGSIKRTLYRMVTSETFCATSVATPSAIERDPANRWCSHAPLRRLSAESLRDSLLATAGKLDLLKFGPPVEEPQPRRSIYLRVRRNAMHPLLSAFDAPTPFTTQGRRDVTNVPAQSLTLMNDPAIAGLASDWVDRERDMHPDDSPELRVRRMFFQATGREPMPAELQTLLTYLKSSQDRHDAHRREAVTASHAYLDVLERQERFLTQVRQRLAATTANKPFDPDSLGPLASWNFSQGADPLHDRRGAMHLSVQGGAKLDADGLVLDGTGYLQSDLLPREVKAKTLEAWVKLDDLTQQGGGVISLQSANGERFDAIVFGEQTAGHWLAGSNGFERTRPFAGPAEDTAHQEPVHLAVVYHSDGRIAAYRNGVPYGESYLASGVATYAARASLVTIGLRHLPAGGNRTLRGRIHSARLYDRALTGDEIQALSSADGSILPLAVLVRSMNADEQAQWKELELQRNARNADREAWNSVDLRDDPWSAWRDLALALFNLKEFLYVR